MRIDLHTHSDCSDGTDPPADLVRAAERAGLDVVALTDHDTFDGLAEAARAAAGGPVTVLPGLELSARSHGSSVHLLGYGCRTDDAALLEELSRIRGGRTDRIPRTVDRLNDLGLRLELDEVEAQAHGASVGRPHVADALVARGYVVNRDEAFDRYLAEDGPAFVDRYAADLAVGLSLVHAAGGAAVIAHPWSRGGAALFTPAFLASLAADHGLDGIEVDHPDHDARARASLRSIAAELGLVATGSSDYHGTGKTRNPLGADLTDPRMLDALLQRVTDRGGRVVIG